MKKILVVLLSSFFLYSCSTQEDPNTVRVGVIAGPEAELMQTAKDVAAKESNLTVKVIEFNDYSTPNEALASGNIDANAFQHLPYLEQAIQAKGYKIVSIAKTFIFPMALYSKKIKSLSTLSYGAIVAIPNDPSNEGRALLLLQKAKLITLKPNVGYEALPADIISNPKHLVFKEIDAAQIPRMLPDVDLAAINTTYVEQAGLSPVKDGLFIEGADSPYVNIIVVRENQKDDPRFAKLIKAYQSNEVIEKAKTLFGDDAIPAWK